MNLSVTLEILCFCTSNMHSLYRKKKNSDGKFNCKKDNSPEVEDNQQAKNS